MRSILLTVAVLLVLPGPAQATVTGTPEAMEMVDLMAVPKPDARVFLEPCPGYDDVAGCAFPDGRIYVPWAPGYDQRVMRSIVYHELGHLFATDRLLQRFRRVTGMERRSDWLVGERFADAYANCAFDALPGNWRFVDGYGYEPSRTMHRRVCALIR